MATHANVVALTEADIARFPTPNYIDPEQQTWAIPLLSVLYTLSTICFLSRVWLRSSWPDWRKNTYSWDDLFLFLGWGLCSGFAFLGLVAMYHFYALRHLWDVPRQYWTKLVLCFWIGELIFIWGAALIKISILLFYRRLTQIAVATTWKLLTWVCIFVVVAYSIGFTVTIIMSCTPVAAFWSAWDPEYEGEYFCPDFQSNNLTAGILNICTDLFTVVLPMAVTRKLDLERRQTIALNAIYLLGLGTVGVSAARTYFHYAMTWKVDLAWQLYYTFTFAQMEMNMGLLCASAPACWSLFRQILAGPLKRLRLRSNPKDTDRSTTLVVSADGEKSLGGTSRRLSVMTAASKSRSHGQLHAIHESRESMEPMVSPHPPCIVVEESDFPLQDWDKIQSGKQMLQQREPYIRKGSIPSN